MEFTNDGKRFLIEADTGSCLWNLPDAAESLPRLQVRAHLLSGQRIDPIIGVLPVDRAALRVAWKPLEVNP